MAVHTHRAEEMSLSISSTAPHEGKTGTQNAQDSFLSEKTHLHLPPHSLHTENPIHSIPIERSLSYSIPSRRHTVQFNGFFQKCSLVPHETFEKILFIDAFGPTTTRATREVIPPVATGLSSIRKIQIRLRLQPTREQR